MRNLAQQKSPAIEKAPPRARAGASTPASMLGNQARLRMLSALRIQAKLEIGAVDDPLEHEADAVADKVTGMPDPAPSIGSAPPQVSRKCAACEAEAEDKDKGELQMRPAGAAQPPTSEAPSIVHNVLSSPGHPLDAASRTYFEPRFGHDFSGVRIHTDSLAAKSADSVGALAYTAGSNIAFAEGRYSPATAAGRRLLAHELTHVVQQRALSPGGALQRQEDMNAGAQAPPDANVPSDEAQNRDSEIEWVSQGSSDAGVGADTAQTLGPTSGAAPTGTTTPEITLETGNTGAGPLNNLVHQQICVDTTGQGSKRCFSFAATGAQLPQFSSTWLGWNSAVIGAIIQGAVYTPRPVPGATVADRHTPTAAQATKWLSYMSGTRLGLQDGYSVARHNCRTFSQWEFRDAPSHW